MLLPKACEVSVSWAAFKPIYRVTMQIMQVTLPRPTAASMLGSFRWPAKILFVRIMMKLSTLDVIFGIAIPKKHLSMALVVGGVDPSSKSTEPSL